MLPPNQPHTKTAQTKTLFNFYLIAQITLALSSYFLTYFFLFYFFPVCGVSFHFVSFISTAISGINRRAPSKAPKNAKKSVIHSTTPEAIAHREKMNKKQEDAEYNLNRPATFRAGLTHFMVKDKSMSSRAAIHVIDEILGNVRETFDKIDKDHNDSISKDELAQLLKEVSGGIESTPEEVDKMMVEIDTVRKFDNSASLCSPPPLERWTVSLEIAC